MSQPQGPFYHGSYRDFPMGYTLRGRGQAYHDEWCVLPCYEAMHLHRPEGILAHQDAVFMCDNPDDVEICGGATERLILLEPIGNVSRHDMNWGNHIALMLEDGRPLTDADVTAACLAYWQGEPFEAGDPAWEYLAAEAKVIACCDYNDPEAVSILNAFTRDSEHQYSL